MRVVVRLDLSRHDDRAAPARPDDRLGRAGRRAARAAGVREARPLDLARARRRQEQGAHRPAASDPHDRPGPPSGLPGAAQSHGPGRALHHPRRARPPGRRRRSSGRPGATARASGLRPAGVRAEGGRASAIELVDRERSSASARSASPLGSLPLYFDHVAPGLVAWTFFVGSIFFTSAAYLQYHETLHAPGGVLTESARPRPLASLVGGRRAGSTAGRLLVQLVGTVFFNISTFAATQAGPHGRAGTAPDLGARRLRLGLLPRRQLARLRRGQPRGPAAPRPLDRLARSRR